MSDDSRVRAGLLFALLAGLFYSLRSVLVRYGLEFGASVNELFLLRMLFTSVLFFIAGKVMRMRGKRPQESLLFEPRMLMAGFLFAAAVLTSLWAVDRLGVALTVILVYAHPAFVVLFARIFHGEQIGGRRLLLLALEKS